jgi:hypothetical protein
LGTNLGKYLPAMLKYLKKIGLDPNIALRAGTAIKTEPQRLHFEGT